MNTEICEDCGLEIDYDLRVDGEGTEAYHVGTGLTGCHGGSDVPVFDKKAINDLLTRAAVNVTESLLQWSKYPNNARRDLQVARDRITHAIDLLAKELDK